MDCRTAEGMVSSYIKHDLPLNELEEFLDHVQNCSSCYDELETYFIVHEVTQQLDDDSSDSVLDFKKTAGTGWNTGGLHRGRRPRRFETIWMETFDGRGRRIVCVVSEVGDLSGNQGKCI